MKKLVDIKNLSVTYKGKESETDAIADINLSIYEEDFVVLLGPSGSGKTTLLNVLAGFVEPSQGQALLQGQPIQGPSKERGVVFQETNLYPWLNIEDNIKFGPRFAQMNEESLEDKAMRLLSIIGLSDFRKHYPFELSGGMQQRVAIARTLINEPSIVLMDEPFGAIDAINRSILQDFLRKLWRDEKMTVFMITHDIDEALTLANRVVLLSPQPGKIAEIIEVDFSRRILENPDYIAQSSEEFIELRQKILKQMQG